MQPKISNFRDEVLAGLSKQQKQIPPKFFYDDYGSKIFDQICELEEYYPTRTEFGILQQHCSDIADQIGENSLIIEYGSGSSQKICLLAFCMAVPLNENWLDFEIIDFNKNISHNCYEYFTRTFDSTPENTWYLDDLGVRKDKRRRGVAKRLLKTCLTELNSKNVFLRTSASNNQAQLLYQNMGFRHMDGLYTQVFHKRLDGLVREDR